MIPDLSRLNSQPSVQLHIERLVLDGLPISPAQGPLIGEAVEAELTRLLTIQGLAAPGSRAEPNLAAGDIRLSPEGRSRSFGQQIGAAVHQVLNQAKQPITNQKANAP
jgi:hypothetical protein